jgi:cell wall-associated NlpC family hydrolase
MKNTKNTKKTRLLALICALCVLSPTATLLACKNEEANLPTPPTSNEIVDTEIDTESDTPNTGDAPNGDGTTAGGNETPPTNSTPPSADEESKPEPPTEPEPTPIPSASTYIRCTGDNVNIRAGAGTNYTVLGQAEKGTTYAVLEKTGGWYKTYYRGKIAYIYAQYASVFSLEKTQDDEVEKVISEGYKLIGVPYVYGAVRLHDGKGNLLAGFTAQKFDCSSLVQYIFYKGAGKLLQVTTRTQFTQGEYVSRNNLQRGDCIYFTNEERQYNTGIEKIGHVAVYLGNDYILHTASDYARIEKMSAQRWKFYVEARRFVK